jgi:hypothetical protein
LTGRFFFKNYRDAVDQIRHGEHELAELMAITKTTPEMLEKYLDDERQYLERVTNDVEDDESSVSAQYVELLEKLATAKYVLINLIDFIH